jgi:putative cardiolipin synthase
MSLQKILVWTLLAAGLITASGCATLPANTNRSESFAYTDTHTTYLGQANAREKSDNPDKSGFILLGDGLDAFVARAVLAHTAQRSIDAQYYLFHNDLTGKLFMDQLLKAADRGVRVRPLVDDMGLEGRDMGIMTLDLHPNMEVRIFNPFSRKTGRLMQFVTGLGTKTRRMHNKSFTVDNQLTILGGRNIGDEYFDAQPDLAFADLDVLAMGPVVNQVSTSFDRYWNHELAYPALTLMGKPPSPEQITEKTQALNNFIDRQINSPYLQALKHSDLAQKIKADQIVYHWGDAEVISDAPEKIVEDRSQTQFHMAPKLAPYLKGINQELIIFSPYFVPGKEGVAFLTGLAGRGIRVRILTNSLASNDVGIVHAGYSKYRKALLKGGVELYEMNKRLTRKQRKDKKGPTGSSKASLHAKSFIFDRSQVFIGSLNLDPRSVTENTEIGVVFASIEIAQGMADWFDQNIHKIAFQLELTTGPGKKEDIVWHGIENGKPKKFTVEPYTGFWRRFGIGLMGILPIESQL